jgi:hypothetical protein
MNTGRTLGGMSLKTTALAFLRRSTFVRHGYTSHHRCTYRPCHAWTSLLCVFSCFFMHHTHNSSKLHTTKKISKGDTFSVYGRSMLIYYYSLLVWLSNEMLHERANYQQSVVNQFLYKPMASFPAAAVTAGVRPS